MRRSKSSLEGESHLESFASFLSSKKQHIHGNHISLIIEVYNLSRPSLIQQICTYYRLNISIPDIELSKLTLPRKSYRNYLYCVQWN